ncbi:MAG TPA: dynamin family protein [Candidatus Limnocylindria bacterium]|jgi:hypothetical protein|nr:dynamin family protein [Candidatus Limnocylindria bacterium]
MSLSARIEALTRTAAPQDEAARGELERIRSRLREPLRVAIAGRVKAGKSTLLNALVGQRLAASDAGECTRIVTWYRDGLTYDVTAMLREGGSQPVLFRRDDGRLEIELGALRPEQVRRLEVTWPSARLAGMTLIDTPGLDGMDTEAEGRTRALFGLAEGEVGEVDAVIYLMRHAHASDAAFLESFRDASVAKPSPANAVAALSRADEIGSARADALSAAATVAERYARDPRLRALCAGIVPVAGLLAEAGATLRESEVAVLRAIVALPSAQQDDLLLSADRFANRYAPVASEARAALLRRLGLFGVRWSVAQIREGHAQTAQELATSLVAVSGIRRLIEMIDENFARRSELLRARMAISSLKRLARAASTHAPGRAFHAELERLEASAPELTLLGLLDFVLSGVLDLTDSEHEEVLRVARIGDAATRLGAPAGDRSTMREIANERIEYWRQRGFDPIATGSMREAADALVRSYEGLLVEASTDQPAT